MAVNSINCSCFSKSQFKNMAFRIILVFNLLFITQRTFADLDYKHLHEKLSLREVEIQKANRRHDGITITVEAGKSFKFSLERYTLQNKGKEKATVRLFEHGKSELPLWLSYKEKSNKLVGVPTNKDIGKIKIILKTGVKGLKRKYKFEMDVKPAKESFYCRDGNPSFAAAAILNIDINKFNGLGRFKLLKKFSDYINVPVHHLRMEERKRDSVFNPSMEMAGPGDGIITEAPGVVVNWRVSCKFGIAGDTSVLTLKQSSGNKFIYENVGVPLLGWYVYKSRQRYRRQAFPAATPGATPAASVPVPRTVTSVLSGTPTISATPSLVKTTTIMVKPTTSYVVIKPTPVVTTKPTKPPTTKPKTTTQLPSTTEEPTTTKPSTQKPETTSMKPEKTTMKPDTTTMKQDITTMKPDTTTMKPDITTMKQDTTTMKPDTTSMKPEATTMKAYTTKSETTEKVDVITKAKTTAEPVVTTEETTTRKVTMKPTVADLPPMLKNSIDLIDVKVGEAFKIKIQRDLFEDFTDGDTYNLGLTLKRNSAQKLIKVDESMIYLDTKNHFLYGLPMLQNSGINSFALQATDSGGNQGNAVFTVKVTDEDLVYNDLFNVTIDIKYDAFMKSAKDKVKFIEKLAMVTNVDYKTLRAQNFYPGSVVVNYASSDFQNDDCNSVKVQKYKSKLSEPEFKDAMAPDYLVLRTSSRSSYENCISVGPSGGHSVNAKSEYKWWEVVLIPVIVIAVLLLVIGLIFFFLYRRKRRYEPQKEDKKTFLYQKKPIIFREEYEEKPDVVSLEPLILPNEKQPIQNAAYQPRTSTPEGNGSLASTEADDKALLENNVGSHTPMASSPPHSPLYGRSPPPYTEP